MNNTETIVHLREQLRLAEKRVAELAGEHASIDRMLTSSKRRLAELSEPRSTLLGVTGG